MKKTPRHRADSSANYLAFAKFASIRIWLRAVFADAAVRRRPKLDMVYILMEQTQEERSRITPAFKALVYDAFKK